MSNLRKFLREHRDEFAENGIRLRPIGNVEGLPASVRRELQATVEATAEGQKLTLCLALNYGAHEEITRAVRRIAREVERGELEPGEIDESTIEAQLDTAGLPELDLMIRTGGEMRVSNFLLWQLHYAEIYVTETYWPDFREEEFGRALHDFARRQRRFGRVPEEEADAEQSDQDARRSVAR
jgi:undecaprenyl diphosphate synthase